MQMPTWQRASRVYRLRVRLVRAYFAGWAVAFGWVGVAVACRIPSALTEVVALSLAGAGSSAFVVAIVAGLFMPGRKRLRNGRTAGLMLFRDVFAGIPAYEPPGRELPTMRWK